MSGRLVNGSLAKALGTPANGTPANGTPANRTRADEARAKATLDKAIAATDLAGLREMILQHVLRAIDFAAIDQLEQMLWYVIPARGIPDKEDTLARDLIDEALRRTPDERLAFFHMGAPPGITKEEERAAEYDDSCPLCVMEMHSPREEHDLDDGCYLCTSLAQEWREEHAEALARHGLGPKSRAPK